MVEKIKKCLLCEETRGIQSCHIVSRKIAWILEHVRDGKQDIENNILLLCPSHHFYFDHGLLNELETETIIIMVKDRINYYFKVIDTLKEQKEGKEILDGNFDKLVSHYLFRNRTIKKHIRFADSIN